MSTSKRGLDSEQIVEILSTSGYAKLKEEAGLRQSEVILDLAVAKGLLARKTVGSIRYAISILQGDHPFTENISLNSDEAAELKSEIQSLIDAQTIVADEVPGHGGFILRQALISKLVEMGFIK